MKEKLNVFISYAHEDQQLYDKLHKHLHSLKQQYINIWHYRDISAGSNWQQVIDDHLNSADIILLLISPDFIASDYCYSKEMQRALEREQAGEACVISIILRPVNWQDAPFSHLQALPTGAKPVTTWRNPDAAFTDIVQGIRKKIEELRDLTEKKEPSEHEKIVTPSTLTSRLHKRGTLLRQYDAHSSWVISVAWEPNGRRMASAAGDGTVRIWDAETGTSLRTYHGHARLLDNVNLHANVYCVAWSPQGEYVASAGDGNTAHVWNVTTGHIRVRYKHKQIGLLPAIYTLSWSPDGQQIASACGSSLGIDTTVHCWSATTGQDINRYSPGFSWMFNFPVQTLSWSPDSTRLAAAYPDRGIFQWNSATGKLISTFHSHVPWTNRLAWSPDSRYLASAHKDGTTRIWNIAISTLITTYYGHTDSVRHVSWSPDGKTVATASNDKTVHLWDPFTATRLYTYDGHSDWVTSVSWSPDGTRLASSSNDKTVHIWQV